MEGFAKVFEHGRKQHSILWDIYIFPMSEYLPSSVSKALMGPNCTHSMVTVAHLSQRFNCRL